MLQEIISLNIWAFFLVFSRIGAAMSVLPGFSASYITMRARLGTAAVISFVLMPLLVSVLPVMPGDVPTVVLLLATEAVVGLFFGMISRIMLSALQSAGSFIAMFSSLSNALVNDPIAEQQSSILAGFLATMGIMVIFTTDTHHMMIRAVAESYTVFEPGAKLPYGDMADYVGHRVSDSFSLGLQIAAPVGLTGLIYYIGLGILGRLMPTLQVFFFGLPVQITLQIVVLALTLPMSMMLFMEHFRNNLVGAVGG